MVDAESVDKQLKGLGFNTKAFSNRAEIRELPNIIIPDEEIFECVNGYYEGGAALLVATNIRVLLIDKKLLNFLTVEDLRYDMINQMDYSHRLFGAHITISVGAKNLTFRSYNKTRLRKLINHVQHCIAQIKMQQSQHQEGQNQHLEQINQQLQTYLVAQYQNQMMLNQRLQEVSGAKGKQLPNDAQPEVVKPSHELSDYLFAQSLLRQHQQEQEKAQQNSGPQQPPMQAGQSLSRPVEQTLPGYTQMPTSQSTEDLYHAGQQEVFGKYNQEQPLSIPRPKLIFDDNPLKIAYSRLHWALSSRRRFGQDGGVAGKTVLPVRP